MKINRLLALMAFAALFLSAYAIVPRIELQPSWIRIQNVERTDSATRMNVRLQHLPGLWVMLSSGTSLISHDDPTQKYGIVGTENIELDQKITMPESGQYEGVLLFEKIPESVKVVDMVEKDLADSQNNVIGIYLDEPETRIRPRTLTLSDIIDNGKNSSEPWSGLDPSKYRDLSFYDTGGKVHIKGNITDYSSHCGFSTVWVMTYDDFTGKEYPHMAKIAPDGSFDMDVQVCYPQFDALEFGSSHDNMFLIPDRLQRQYLFFNPGDTISVSTCVASRFDKHKGLVPEYFGFEGKPNESTVISLLADSLINQRYDINSLYFKHFVDIDALMERKTIEATEKLCHLIDSVMADLPEILGDLPVSNYAKDVLSAYAVGQIELLMEELEMYLRATTGPSANGSSMLIPGGGTYNIKNLTAPKLRHKNLLFDNPLLLCLSGILVRRWEDNKLFFPVKLAGCGMVESSESGKFYGTDNVSEPFDVANYHLISAGVGNCFAAQLIQSRSYIDFLHTRIGPISWQLERNSKILPYIIKQNSSDTLNSIVMKEYNDFVKDATLEENAHDSGTERDIVIEESSQEDILEKIIAPYRGNVIYLDFWGMSCAPCRAGMIKQKPILEQLSGQPFRVLYIASLEDGIETCKAWLKQQDIKGEHIFVSSDDWMRLRKLFNFNGIPFGVLIGKDGKVINPDYHFYLDEPQFKKALEE